MVILITNELMTKLHKESQSYSLFLNLLSEFGELRAINLIDFPINSNEIKDTRKKAPRKIKLGIIWLPLMSRAWKLENLNYPYPILLLSAYKFQTNKFSPFSSVTFKEYHRPVNRFITLLNRTKSRRIRFVGKEYMVKRKKSLPLYVDKDFFLWSGLFLYSMETNKLILVTGGLSQFINELSPSHQVFNDRDTYESFRYLIHYIIKN